MSVTIYSNGDKVVIPSCTSQDIYSTEEQVVGRWIDGKPLYRRVFQGNNITKYGAWTIWLKDAIPNVSYVSKIRTTYTRATGFVNCEFTNIVSTEISNTGDILLYMENGASSFSGIPITVTVEYTKTTDEGV